MPTENASSVKTGGESAEISRREFGRRAITATASFSSLPALLAACGQSGSSGTSASAASKELTLVSTGGSYGDAFQRIVINPFQLESGIKVTLLANTSLAGLKLQVQSGHVTWDDAELFGGDYYAAVPQGLVEPLDYPKINTSKLLPGSALPYGISGQLYIFGMAWNSRAIPNEQAPQTWQDFWDTKRYPGKRSLYQNLTDGSILEAALMADGVPLSQIYPLDVKRALNSLDRLGKKNIIWHTTNAEPIQQLISGEVNLATSFNGRVLLASTRLSAPLSFAANQGAISTFYYVVPKGAPHRDAMWKLLSFMFTNDQVGLDFTLETGYPIANKDLASKLPQNFAATLPNSPQVQGRTIRKDDEWWGKNLSAVQQQFTQWQLTR